MYVCVRSRGAFVCCAALREAFTASALRRNAPSIAAALLPVVNTRKASKKEMPQMVVRGISQTQTRGESKSRTRQHNKQKSAPIVHLALCLLMALPSRAAELLHQLQVEHPVVSYIHTDHTTSHGVPQGQEEEERIARCQINTMPPRTSSAGVLAVPWRCLLPSSTLPHRPAPPTPKQQRTAAAACSSCQVTGTPTRQRGFLTCLAALTPGTV